MIRWICAGVACASLVVGATGCSERMGKGWDWNRMRSQPKYQPYRGSSFFADGRAMQLSPTGAISREEGAGDTARLVVTDNLVARGAERFHVYCAVCHGERGDGASIVAINMDPPKPPSLISSPASRLSASEIATLIADGAGRMPSFASELPPSDRQAVAEYVKMLQVRGGAAR